MEKNMKWLKESYIAHRGFHDAKSHVYENTKTAFLKAIQLGFSIELDTNILKDGTVVVFHDRNLKRLCGIDQELKDTLYSEIQSLKILDSNDTIMTLESVLDLIHGSVPVLIELKPFGDKKAHFQQVLSLLRNYQGIYAIHSFNPIILYYFKKHASDIIRGQITSFFKEDMMSRLTKLAMKRMWFNPITKPDFINYQIDDLPNPYVDKLKSRGVIILAYAAQNKKALAFVRKKYDNAVFENFNPLDKVSKHS